MANISIKQLKVFVTITQHSTLDRRLGGSVSVKGRRQHGAGRNGETARSLSI